MYADLDASSQRAISAAAFTHQLAAAKRTATMSSARLGGRVRMQAGGEFEVPVRVRTRLFGVLALDYAVSIGEHGGSARVRFSGTLRIPRAASGRAPGAADVPASPRHPAGPRWQRAGGNARGRRPSGEAQTRASLLGSVASAVLGEVGPLPSERRAQLEAHGLPAQGPVGTSGIELALDERLRGTPGGELLAGSRVLAGARARPAAPVRTTISPTVQRAAVEALGGQYGGIVAMVPSSGQILAVAGIGLDGLQPPGSTFKMVTVSGVLSAHLASPRSVFPYATHADARRRLAEQRPRRGLRRDARTRLRGVVQLGVRAARREAGRRAARGDGRSARLQPPAGDPGRGREHAPARGRNRRRTGARLDRDRAGAGARERRSRWRRVAATIADGGRRPQPTFLTAPRAGARARAAERQRRAHRAQADDRRRAGRHRHVRRDPGRDGRGQDRHGRTEERLPPTESGSGSRRTGARRNGRGRLRGAKAKRPTPTPGSRPSRPRCTRGWWWACCSSKTAPAARRPRRSRAQVLEAALRRASGPAPRAAPLRRRARPGELSTGSSGSTILISSGRLSSETSGS